MIHNLEPIDAASSSNATLAKPNQPVRSPLLARSARAPRVATQPLRICRANAVVGKWPRAEVLTRLADGDLLSTDFYYDEEASDWMPLSGLSEERAVVAAPKCFKRLCYCGSAISFHVCCGTKESL